MTDMTLQEAINHAREKADELCGDCSKEHEKLAKWLEELQEFRSIGKSPADVRHVVRGHWAWNEDGIDWNIGAWCCSECGRKPETWWEGMKNVPPLRCAGSKFCGNCGADMRGVKDVKAC